MRKRRKMTVISSGGGEGQRRAPYWPPVGSSFSLSAEKMLPTPALLLPGERLPPHCPPHLLLLSGILYNSWMIWGGGGGSLSLPALIFQFRSITSDPDTQADYTADGSNATTWRSAVTPKCTWWNWLVLSPTAAGDKKQQPAGANKAYRLTPGFWSSYMD